MTETVFHRYLARAQNQGRYRKLQTKGQGFGEGAPYPKLDFSSHDVLGLARHPAVLKAAVNAGETYGVGASGSRLLSGNEPIFEDLEHTLARDMGCESALFFISGYQANVSMLGAVLHHRVHEKAPLVLCDRLNHASLYQGIVAAQSVHGRASCVPKVIRYPHLDCDAVEHALRHYHDYTGFKIVVSETLFGMEGDCPDLMKLYEMCAMHDAMLYLDDCHGTGLYGDQGYGLSTHVRGEGPPVITLGSFSKALGGSGAFITCPQFIKDYALHAAPGFIYSTAPSPMVAGAALCAWQMLPHLGHARQSIHDIASYLRDQLRAHHIKYQGEHHIVSILIGDSERALKVAESLQNYNIYVSCVRPPTVPVQTARLKITLSVDHTHADIQRLVETMLKVGLA